jgi:hypothetical protein
LCSYHVHDPCHSQKAHAIGVSEKQAEGRAEEYISFFFGKCVKGWGCAKVTVVPSPDTSPVPSPAIAQLREAVLILEAVLCFRKAA